MALQTVQKKQTAYRLQFSISQILGVGGLFSLSLIFSFYLGLVTGKSFRPPADSISLKAVEANPEATTPLAPEELSFFQSMEEQEPQKQAISTEKLESLRQTTTRITEKQKLVEKEKQAKTDTQQQAAPAPTTPPPTEPLVTAKPSGTYTLQVFTSGNKKTAETWVKRLKESGYLDAYLDPVETDDNKMLYRVRISKTSKASAESLADKLKKLDYIEHVQITRL